MGLEAPFFNVIHTQWAIFTEGKTATKAPVGLCSRITSLALLILLVIPCGVGGSLAFLVDRVCCCNKQLISANPESVYGEVEELNLENPEETGQEETEQPSSDQGLKSAEEESTTDPNPKEKYDPSVLNTEEGRKALGELEKILGPKTHVPRDSTDSTRFQSLEKFTIADADVPSAVRILSRACDLKKDRQDELSSITEHAKLKEWCNHNQSDILKLNLKGEKLSPFPPYLRSLIGWLPNIREIDFTNTNLRGIPNLTFCFNLRSIIVRENKGVLTPDGSLMISLTPSLPPDCKILWEPEALVSAIPENRHPHLVNCVENLL